MEAHTDFQAMKAVEIVDPEAADKTLTHKISALEIA